MRDATEKPEGISARGLKLIGTDEEAIYEILRQLLEDKDEYEKISKVSNP
jgi:UDP-N-acetylglucosamine 2-epimerase (non-hydrolysing)